MKNQRTSGITRRDFLKSSLASIAYTGLATSFLGCATSGSHGGLFGNYGDLSSSKEVTKSFRNYEVKPDHNYFRAGPKENSPNVILGLDKKYTLDNPRFWHPVDPNTLQDLVVNMQDEASESDATLYGADILDHNKNDIGDWYSTANRTTVKMKDGKRVTIYTPSAGMSGGGSSSGASSSGGGHGGN